MNLLSNLLSGLGLLCNFCITWLIFMVDLTFALPIVSSSPFCCSVGSWLLWFSSAFQDMLHMQPVYRPPRVVSLWWITSSHARAQNIWPHQVEIRPTCQASWYLEILLRSVRPDWQQHKRGLVLLLAGGHHISLVAFIQLGESPVQQTHLSTFPSFASIYQNSKTHSWEMPS